MSKVYIIRKDDTLSKIAKRFYGDTTLTKKLADYNGIRDPNSIQVNQNISIPSLKELTGLGSVTPTSLAIKVPNGLDEIIRMFGDIYVYIRPDGMLDPKWEANNMVSAPIPFAIPLSWDPVKKVTSIYGHKKLAAIYTAVFTEIQNKGLADKITRYGGCYNFRAKRTSSKLSVHAWGIGLDLNPETNMQGTTGNMPDGVIKIFRAHGFIWGGDWTGKSKDPMHFQYASGY